MMCWRQEAGAGVGMDKITCSQKLEDVPMSKRPVSRTDKAHEEANIRENLS